MSENNTLNRETRYEEAEALTEESAEELLEEQPEIPREQSPEDKELAARIEARRRLTRRSNTRKKRRTTIMMILIFAALLTMCSREIVKLKAENYELQKQHAQLEQERDRLTSELGRVGDKEYIKEQARKQLKLLDPGEIMFIFDDGTGNADNPAEDTGEKGD